MNFKYLIVLIGVGVFISSFVWSINILYEINYLKNTNCPDFFFQI